MFYRREFIRGGWIFIAELGIKYFRTNDLKKREKERGSIYLGFSPVLEQYLWLSTLTIIELGILSLLSFHDSLLGCKHCPVPAHLALAMWFASASVCAYVCCSYSAFHTTPHRLVVLWCFVSCHRANMVLKEWHVQRLWTGCAGWRKPPQLTASPISKTVSLPCHFFKSFGLLDSSWDKTYGNSILHKVSVVQ